MKKNKQLRLLAILALFVSVVGLTLGFAAFSNTLTIRSGASVKPNDSDFKLVLYGMPDIVRSSNFNIDLSLFTSTTAIGPVVGYKEDGTVGVLDNDNLAIKNITAKFEGPDEDPLVDYFFLLKNEGEYDAYMNVNNLQMPAHTCTADEETTDSLVQEACKGLSFNMAIAGYVKKNSSQISTDITEFMDASGNVKIGIGEALVSAIQIHYRYGSARADGPFTAKWENLELDFSTTKK